MRDIFDYKLPMTEVKGSSCECTVQRLWYIAISYGFESSDSVLAIQQNSDTFQGVH